MTHNIPATLEVYLWHINGNKVICIHFVNYVPGREGERERIVRNESNCSSSELSNSYLHINRTKQKSNFRYPADKLFQLVPNILFIKILLPK